MEHIDHNTESLKKFCERKEKDVLAKISFEELVVNLRWKEDRKLKKREDLDKEQKNAKQELSLSKNINEKGKDTVLERELTYLENVGRFLVEMGEKVSTVVFREACEEALKLFDLEGRVREELKSQMIDVEESKKRIDKLERRMEELDEDIKILDYLVGNNKEWMFNEEKWTTFLLLNEKILLFTPAKYCINTTVRKFTAFPFVDRAFNIERVMRKKLVNVGERVRISKPVKVERELVTGYNIYASLSHQGVLAIYDGRNIVQFANVNNYRQAKINVESTSITGFYDNNMLLLTYGKPLREAIVEKVFGNPNIEMFKEIEGTGDVRPYTDVSLLQERRVLYYPTTNGKLFAFNVDTRTNTEINVGRNVWNIASLTGIDSGVKAVFRSDDNCAYTLNMDDTVTQVAKRQSGSLTTLLFSTSNPKSFKDAVFVYGDYLVKDEKEMGTSRLITFHGDSMVRVYRDIFLTCVKETRSWVLVRVVVF